MLGVATVAHREKLVFPFEDGLREEKTRGELLVVARASHDDGHALALQSNLERLLDRDVIFARLSAVGVEMVDGR